jgi:hypothetical protein
VKIETNHSLDDTVYILTSNRVWQCIVRAINIIVSNNVKDKLLISYELSSKSTDGANVNFNNKFQFEVFGTKEDLLKSL